MANLTIELAKAKEEIEAIARGYGLDFFQTIFEVLEFDDLNQIAAFGGFPVRYPHWSFGMEYESLSKGYEYGLSKIYELVINNDPCVAYLMKSNPLVDQKLVMAHVYGHCDFFKNNYWFSKTNRKMIDRMANNATRVRRYIDQVGFEEVEKFIDVCKSLENLIDFHLPFIQRPSPLPENVIPDEVRKLRSKGYMDSYINPPEYLEQQRKDNLEKALAQQHFPPQPVKDIMGFLMEFGQLQPWQQEIMGIIRSEAYYFAPQGQTKIMNEGWASYWHSTMMTRNILKDSEVIDYADHHAGTVAMSGGRLNPYKLGIELFRDIEERWNKGQFGKAYDECDDLTEKKNWDKNLGLGREKIFEVRKIYNDVMFLDEFLTVEFCQKYKLFMFAYSDRKKTHEIVSREFAQIKQSLLYSLTNMGRPQVEVVDGNYQNRGELLIQHTHEGVDLKLDWAKDTLENIQLTWGRPVNLFTVLGNKEKILRFDGKEHSDESVDAEKKAS